MTKSEKSADSPFKRFKKLTKDLLSVSRKELQEEMDKYKRERHDKKKKRS